MLCFYVTVPMVITSGSTGLADMPLALFYTGSVIFLLKYISDKKFKDLIFCILYSVFCAFTKNEGLPLIGINIFVLAFNLTISKIDKHAIRALFFYIFTFLILYLPWLIFSKSIPKTHENYMGQLNAQVIFNNLSRLKLIIPEFLKQIVSFEDWGVLWICLIATSIIFHKKLRNKEIYNYCLLLFLQTFLYIFVFIITPWDVMILSRLALARILLHMAPITILLIAYLSGNILDKQDPYKNINT